MGNLEIVLPDIGRGQDLAPHRSMQLQLYPHGGTTDAKFIQDVEWFLSQDFRKTITTQIRGIRRIKLEISFSDLERQNLIFMCILLCRHVHTNRFKYTTYVSFTNFLRIHIVCTHIVKVFSDLCIHK